MFDIGLWILPSSSRYLPFVNVTIHFATRYKVHLGVVMMTANGYIYVEQR